MTILERLKVRLNIKSNEKDDLLSGIIDDIKAYIVTFCNLPSVEDIPSTLDGAVIRMAVIDYNRLGSEGLNSESYAGASYSYNQEYPEEIKKELYHERLLVMD